MSILCVSIRSTYVCGVRKYTRVYTYAYMYSVAMETHGSKSLAQPSPTSPRPHSTCTSPYLCENKTSVRHRACSSRRHKAKMARSNSSTNLKSSRTITFHRLCRHSSAPSNEEKDAGVGGGGELADENGSFFLWRMPARMRASQNLVRAVGRCASNRAVVSCNLCVLRVKKGLVPREKHFMGSCRGGGGRRS
jgi:hypothetical protein